MRRLLVVPVLAALASGIALLGTASAEDTTAPTCSFANVSAAAPNKAAERLQEELAARAAHSEIEIQPVVVTGTTHGFLVCSW